MNYLLSSIILLFSFISNSQVDLDENIQVQARFNAETDVDSNWYKLAYANTPNKALLLIVDYPDVPPLLEGQYNHFENIIVEKFDVNTRSLKKTLKERAEVEMLLTFRLNEKGEVSEVKIVSGISGEIDIEMSRIIEDGNWTNGEHKGKPAPYFCSLRVVFKKSDAK